MDAGISLFLGTPPKQNEQIIEKARTANVKSVSYTHLTLPTIRLV